MTDKQLAVLLQHLERRIRALYYNLNAMMEYNKIDPDSRIDSLRPLEEVANDLGDQARSLQTPG